MWRPKGVAWADMCEENEAGRFIDTVEDLDPFHDKPSVASTESDSDRSPLSSPISVSSCSSYTSTTLPLETPEEPKITINNKNKKKHPRTFSRRAVVKKANAARLAAEEEERKKVLALVLVLRTTFCVVFFVKKLRSRARLSKAQRILRRVYRLARHKVIRERSMRLWVRNHRTKTYIGMIQCHASHFWMDHNFMRTLLQFIKETLATLPKNKRQGCPPEVKSILYSLEALTEERPIYDKGKDYTTVKGAMTSAHKILDGQTKTFANLRAMTIMKKHYHHPHINHLIFAFMSALERRKKTWRMIMERTYTYCLQVPIMHAENPDWILMSALLKVPMPRGAIDPVARLWSAISGFPVKFGFPKSMYIRIPCGKGQCSEEVEMDVEDSILL